MATGRCCKTPSIRQSLRNTATRGGSASPDTCLGEKPDFLLTYALGCFCWCCLTLRSPLGLISALSCHPSTRAVSSLCLLTLCIFLNDAISFGLHSVLFVYSTGLTQGGCCLERNRCDWLQGGEDGLALEAVTLTLTLTHRRPRKMGTITFTWLLEEVTGHINHLREKRISYLVALQVWWLAEEHYKCSYYGADNAPVPLGDI